MKNSTRIGLGFILVALSILGLSAQAQGQPAQVNSREVSDILQRLTQGSVKFRDSLNAAPNRNGVGEARAANQIHSLQRSFETATNQLNDRFRRRRAGAADVRNVLQKASPLNDSINRWGFDAQAQNDWAAVRSNLDALANAYAISWQWNQQTQIGYGANTGANNGLTGTFRLDSSRSDNARQVAERATYNLSNGDRQDASTRLEARLESPEMLAIERSGSTVTIASSRTPRSTFLADGRQHEEQLPSGRSAQLIATLRGDQLIVSSTGSGDTDFSITFDPIDDGRRLNVTRKIHSSQLTQPLIVKSVYERTSDISQWSVYNGSKPVLGNTSSNNTGDFIVRDGESLTAVLNNDLTSKQARPGDRFTMTVRQPGEYEAAIIEGTVASITESGRLAGRSGMSLNFDTIRLRNGQTYRFAGTLESVRSLNGDTVKVDNEGSAQGDNQTTKTVQRTGIATAIGALIGAIAGGAKGAAIGGVIGAAGGAGSVYAQGKDDLELPSGTEITIRATAPGR
jgi:hypothetical protein